MASPPPRLSSENQAIYDYMKANPLSYVQLATTINGSSDYIMKKISIVNAENTTNPDVSTIVNEIKGLASKPPEQKIVDDRGVLYYIPKSDYDTIESNHKSTMALLSLVDLVPRLVATNTITDIKYDKLGDLFKHSKSTWSAKDVTDDVIKNKAFTKVKPSLSPEQIKEIDEFNDNLQKLIKDFNVKDADRKTKHTKVSADPTDLNKTAYQKAHSEALILYEVCKQLITDYNDMIKELNNKSIPTTVLKQQTNITGITFDVLTAINIP